MAFDSFKYEKNLVRNIIEVKERIGIPPEHRDVLYTAMKAYETQARLLVTLFFMADLSVEQHTLDRIELNLKQIFPPIGLQKLEPEDFGNFRVTCITSLLRGGESEYFVSPKRGRWTNTDSGNKEALTLLRRGNVVVNLLRRPERSQEGPS